MRILGIDPGTGIMGFGVVDAPDTSATTSARSDPSVRGNTVVSGGVSGGAGAGAGGGRMSDLSFKLVDAGVITTPAHTAHEIRLEDIFDSLTAIIKATKPDVCSVERLFFSHNITTAMSVAEARGVAILVARQHHLPIFEYTPQQIKQTLTGYGKADKKQVQEMVRMQLGLKTVPKPDDCADALAAAITHAVMSRAAHLTP